MFPDPKNPKPKSKIKSCIHLLDLHVHRRVMEQLGSRVWNRSSSVASQFRVGAQRMHPVQKFRATKLPLSGGAGVGDFTVHHNQLIHSIKTKL